MSDSRCSRTVQLRSICEVELQNQIRRFEKIVFVAIIGMLLQLANVLLFVDFLASDMLLQVYDIMYWLHLGCLYWVMWDFAMMFYFPCKLYCKVQSSHV